MLARYDLVPQRESPELIADRWDITRSEMDELALSSHRRAHAATEPGCLREIVPVETRDAVHRTDQGIRADTTLNELARLRTVFREDRRVIAGNASQVSDGAAALLLMSSDKAAQLGMGPRARVIDQVVLGVDPVTMLTGPIPATERILRRNGLAISDLSAIEINEALSSGVLAWAREHAPDMSRVNPRGRSPSATRWGAPVRGC